MLFYYTGYVVYATVAHFNGIGVEDFVQLTVFRKTLFNKI